MISIRNKYDSRLPINIETSHLVVRFLLTYNNYSHRVTHIESKFLIKSKGESSGQRIAE